MLLYTKLAPPKAPKKRSRAGCAQCKEKKKKCDEKRPQCSRCVERSVECAYEAIKPRQRRKRDSQSGFKIDTSLECISIGDGCEWGEPAETPCESEYFSPLETKLGMSPSSHIFTDTTDDPISPSYETNTDDNECLAQPIVRRGSSARDRVSSSARALLPELAMISPCPVGSPTLEFRIPAFSEFSSRPNRRALVDHFCNVLSHLIVFREESGNPFQQLVLPLSHTSSPVMNAIYALASAHLEYRGVQNSEKSLYFHNQAIQGLARLIESQTKVNKNELLAAIMLLVYYEVLVQRGRTSIIDGHLKGAFAIMCLNQDLLTPVGLFLERAFGFYDVITALSLGTPPLSTAPGAGGLLPVPPPDAPPASPLTNVDTLLGMATTLWPIMHRLSNLLFTKKELEKAQGMGQVSKVAVLRTELETTSQAIEAALSQWKPCLPPNIVIRDDDVLVLKGVEREEIPEMARLQSILHNALAYRHSAFVYLYRTIYGYSPKHKLVQQHSHTSLHHCVETTAARGPMSALLWPLFAAACEAISAEDRELAKKAFSEIEQRQGMTNIQEAWGIIQEVWKRLDLVEDDAATRTNPDLWRSVCADMGVTIVFG
ncbi:putative fungal zn binuclear cluster domain-containing protein [Rosellinia necatrix]|uniref:Putative fungal zn binuclear cluster domain-containing protein n=1 Tax=Rosellinia necatrix TaxID=77044 RepID=A0A1S8A8Y1_ROSNE|nr:putative fungal zn binuclear cluster domain-containing protein [Rosellinia necatrix]